jgi:ribosome biogenesis GTPase
MPGGPTSLSTNVRDLRRLGWDAHCEAALGVLEGDAWMPARVFSDGRGVLTLSDGVSQWGARVSGRLRHKAQSTADLPVVGDWVLTRADDEQPGAVVHVMLPRRTRIARKVAGDRPDEQVLAANVDVVVIVMGQDSDLNPRRLDRYLTLVRQGGAKPIALLSKADLAAGAGHGTLDLAALAAGVVVLSADLLRGEVPPPLVAELTPGRTVALVGSSGAGKSTLINRLLARDVQRTAAVRAYDERGRHTTTHRQMFELPGGALVIDTPGLREIQLTDTEEEPEVFPDVAELAASCRFRDCHHEQEPGCAVRDAVANGQLAAERFERFQRLARGGDARRRRRGSGR